MTRWAPIVRRPVPDPADARAYRVAVADLVAVVMGKTDGEDDGRWCPAVSPHAAVPLKNRAELEWSKIFPGDGRVVEYTCDCGMTVYELISYGGVFRIRRTTSAKDVPPVSYTHGWRRLEALEQWRLLLAGQAR